MRSGKRLASCSTLLIYKGYAGEIDDRILMACTGIELYRHAILVHDDLVDEDDMRRGAPSIHKIFEDKGDIHLGMGVAVFAGNMLYSLACEAIVQSDFPPGKVQGVLSLLVSEYREVNESQLLDLWFEYAQPTVEDWYTMATKRASSLFRTTLLTGAILAEASEEEKNILAECARHIGLSFDIQDDIIGTFATEEQYGRPTDGDIRTGKKHLHVVYALQSDESENLRSILGKKDATEQEVDQAREIMRKYGLEKAKQRSFEHAERAINLMGSSDLSSESKDFFQEFIRFVSQSLEWYK